MAQLLVSEVPGLSELVKRLGIPHDNVHLVKSGTELLIHTGRHGKAQYESLLNIEGGRAIYRGHRTTVVFLGSSQIDEVGDAHRCLWRDAVVFLRENGNAGPSIVSLLIECSECGNPQKDLETVGNVVEHVAQHPAIVRRLPAAESTEAQQLYVLG